MRLVIQVLQEDIDLAIKERSGVWTPGSPFLPLARCCPIYQALKREGKDVSVGVTQVFQYRTEEVLFSLPPEARRAVSLPSRDWPKLVPFSFEVETSST